jgi:hypothetical protein
MHHGEHASWVQNTRIVLLECFRASTMQHLVSDTHASSNSPHKIQHGWVWHPGSWPGLLCQLLQGQPQACHRAILIWAVEVQNNNQRA